VTLRLEWWFADSSSTGGGHQQQQAGVKKKAVVSRRLYTRRNELKSISISLAREEQQDL
jgi:hypothetical protein